MGDVGRRGGALVLGVAEALGDAAQDLARNDTGVTAGTHEGAVRYGLGDVFHRGGGGQHLHLADHGAERERHVRARVTIGDGKDVELVDFL